MAPVKTYQGLDEIEKAVGTLLGHSEWHTITQDDIDRFADVTGDHQWIHIDPEKAAKGPYGTTIAHGYLVLSLVPMLMSEVTKTEGLTAAINYGSNKVRYPAPTPVDSQVRGAVELLELSRRPQGAQAVFRVTVERQGGDKPVCVAEVVSVLFE
ncbi:MaoC family dehydratase [Streptomyces sp. 3214.6]|uniref:MaoC family dehydratase n=1 Tax=Streptomyces sp. 3214.6 TaxID=1882757 RepID=UPI00090C7E71|nr:MaoC family dehydratase [Streptomyces sp. 3214.6]SHH31159.1 Acyl dehydratase [Streptomyces sp. 3214.6]